jgi:hypothetical protein
MTPVQLREKAFDIIDLVDIDKLISNGLTTIELAYVLSLVDNIISIKASTRIGIQKSESRRSTEDT